MRRRRYDLIQRILAALADALAPRGRRGLQAEAEWQRRDRAGIFDWMLHEYPYVHKADEPLVILGWADGALTPRTLLTKGSDFRCLFGDESQERKRIKLWERAACLGAATTSEASWAAALGQKWDMPSAFLPPLTRH